MSKKSRRNARFIRAAMDAYPQKRVFAAVVHFGASMMAEALRLRKFIEELEAIAGKPLPVEFVFKVDALPCWIETRECDPFPDTLIKTGDRFILAGEPCDQYTAANYGRTWRCWATVKPTEEKCRAAAWRD